MFGRNKLKRKIGMLQMELDVFEAELQLLELEAEESVKILRDLVDLHIYGAPLERYRIEWEETMERASEFLDKV